MVLAHTHTQGAHDFSANSRRSSITCQRNANSFLLSYGLSLSRSLGLSLSINSGIFFEKKIVVSLSLSLLLPPHSSL